MYDEENRHARDSALIERIGLVMHGPLWKQALADDLQTSHSALYAQAADKRSVTPAMRRRLLEFVRSAPELLSERLKEKMRLLRQIEAELVAKGDTPDPKLPKND